MSNDKRQQGELFIITIFIILYIIYFIIFIFKYIYMHLDYQFIFFSLNKVITKCKPP